jgi:hypothetical protein
VPDRIVVCSHKIDVVPNAINGRGCGDAPEIPDSEPLYQHVVDVHEVKAIPLLVISLQDDLIRSPDSYDSQPILFVPDDFDRPGVGSRADENPGSCGSPRDGVYG